MEILVASATSMWQFCAGQHAGYCEECFSPLTAGVIAVETQTTMLNIPADPGAPDSSERIIPQAGQVCAPATLYCLAGFFSQGLCHLVRDHCSCTYASAAAASGHLSPPFACLS